VDRPRLRVWHRTDRVHDHVADRAQGFDQRRSPVLAGHEADADRDDETTADRLWDHRHVRQAHHGDRGDHFVWKAGDPCPVCVQDLGRDLSGEDQGAGEELVHGEEIDLDPGDHAEVPAASTDGPEQIAVFLGGGRADLPVGRHDFCAANVVCGPSCARPIRGCPPPEM
jgi:hypothetical protein